MNEIRNTEQTCPRCGRAMEHGFLNAGKGPFRWTETPKQHKTIFGGEHLVTRNGGWGRLILPAARCPGCKVGVFVYEGDASGQAGEL